MQCNYKLQYYYQIKEHIIIIMSQILGNGELDLRKHGLTLLE